MNIVKLKTALLESLHQQLNQRIQTAQSAIDSAKDAKSQETKSTAGDKHETGRAMMQIEQEKNEMQLGKAKSLQGVLSQIDARDVCQLVKLGSLVKTNTGNYFISIGSGKIVLDNQTIYAVSLQAPLTQAILGKEKAWSGFFNDRVITIEEIF